MYCLLGYIFQIQCLGHIIIYMYIYYPRVMMLTWYGGYHTRLGYIGFKTHSLSILFSISSFPLKDMNEVFFLQTSRSFNTLSHFFLYFLIKAKTNHLFGDHLQYWSLLNWQNLRLRCVCVAVAVNWFFNIISSFFAKFKNVVHSLEPGETPSYSASHQAPNYVQCS